MLYTIDADRAPAVGDHVASEGNRETGQGRPGARIAISCPNGTICCSGLRRFGVAAQGGGEFDERVLARRSVGDCVIASQMCAART